jgi:hypothetical protein
VQSVAKSNENEKLDLTVSSYALKRDLAKKVNSKYMGQSIFTEFKKNTDTFTIKKWKKRNNPPGRFDNKKQTPTAQTEVKQNPETAQ